jgi:von Willebrand factor type A domain
MFAKKSNATVLERPIRIRNPGLGTFAILGLALVFTQCTQTDEKMTDGFGELGDHKDVGVATEYGGPRIPAQAGDSAQQPQAGQLTAGEIDDHLNFPLFKTYILQALQAARKPDLEFSLPDEAEVKDRFAGNAPRPKALDLAFAIDATGSMEDEMAYLAAEFQAILGRIQSRHPEFSIRYGLVFYRDHGDQFVVQSHAFQASAEATQSILKGQNANGGGDMPEAMDEGLAAALGLDWRGSSVASQMLFLVADAPPHDASIAPFLKAVDKAASQGIRIYPLAASSSDELTELLMRIAAFVSSGSYSFLTNDSGIGNDHKEPSVPCYVVTRLDELLTRLIEEEIAGARIEPEPASIIRTSGNYAKGYCKDERVAAQ